MKTPIDQRPLPACRPAVQLRRQEEILDMAIGLFAKHGYFETDTQLLADQLHVGKGTLYRYFRTKEELFLAAADSIMRKLHERIVSATAGVEDPLDLIREGVYAYLAFFAEHPEYAELVIQERALFKDRPRPTYLQHRDVNEVRWRELYRSLAAKGEIRDMPAERITDIIGDLLYGTMYTNLFAQQRKSPEAQTSAILDVVFYGILSDSERQRRGP